MVASGIRFEANVKSECNRNVVDLELDEERRII